MRDNAVERAIDFCIASSVIIYKESDLSIDLG